MRARLRRRARCAAGTASSGRAACIRMTVARRLRCQRPRTGGTAMTDRQPPTDADDRHDRRRAAPAGSRRAGRRRPAAGRRRQPADRRRRPGRRGADDGRDPRARSTPPASPRADVRTSLLSVQPRYDYRDGQRADADRLRAGQRRRGHGPRPGPARGRRRRDARGRRDEHGRPVVPRRRPGAGRTRGARRGDGRGPRRGPTSLPRPPAWPSCGVHATSSRAAVRPSRARAPRPSG